MNKLKQLFLTELADRYDSEKRLVSAMAKMAKAATCKHLEKLIRFHLKETERHVKQLECVFKSFDEKAKTRKCEATIGLLKEGADMAAEFKKTTAINAALVSVAQKIEHYEIAAYGCLRAWAELLGNKEAADLLESILAEEKAANESLIELARTHSNREALGDGCTAADSGCDAEGTKPRNLARGMRPVKINRLSPPSLKS
jgi:ferritin-like metal-binding protein YciE